MRQKKKGKKTEIKIEGEKNAPLFAVYDKNGVELFSVRGGKK